MGKKSRRVRRRTESMPYVARPFEGLPNEADWVALHGFVEAGTGVVTLRDGRRVTMVSRLPRNAPGMVRGDGELLVALQVAHDFGDVSRDLAHVIELSEGYEPGQSITMTDPGVGRRLQDLIEPASGFTLEVTNSFDFWLDPSEDAEPPSLEFDTLMVEAQHVLNRSRAVRPDAYITDYGSIETFVRWFLPADGHEILTALARLHVAEADLVAGRPLLGTFHADGIPVLVWELDQRLKDDVVIADLAVVETRLAEARAETGELTARERAARQSLLARQVVAR